MAEKPDFKIQIGSIKAAVWPGEHGPSIKLTKSYKDRNDQWVDQSMSMFESDLSVLGTVLGRIESYLAGNSQQAPTRARTAVGESEGRGGYSDTPRASGNSPRASAPVGRQRNAQGEWEPIPAGDLDDGDVPF